MHPCSSGILKGMGRWLEELWLPDHGSDHRSWLSDLTMARLLSCPDGLVSKLMAGSIKQRRKKSIAQGNECIQERHLLHLPPTLQKCCRS